MPRQIIARYTGKLPLTLFRIQVGELHLRDFKTQKAKGSSSFDVTIKEDGLYHPAPSNGVFIGPNGASLRPNSLVMHELLDNFPDFARIYIIPKDTPLPNYFALLHEHSDHYSLQTSIPVSLHQYNMRLVQFFDKLEYMSIQEFIQNYPVTEAINTKMH